MAQQLARGDEGLVRKASATRILSLGLFAAVIAGELASVIIWLADRSYPVIPTTIVALIIVFTTLLSFWLASSGKARTAGYLFVISFLVETAAITILFGGATGPLVIIYVFSILTAGMVIGIRSGFFIATLATALYLMMIPLERTGLIPPLIPGNANGAIVPLFLAVQIIMFYLTAFLSWFAASRLSQALHNVSLYAGELQTANEKLQASEEELRASNEELEAANEELRATEEELRASNEELEAANRELKEAQEQLVRSEKLAAIGQLAGGVGHELRNPLGAIKNAVYYIRGKIAKSEVAEKEPRVVEFLDIVDDEINSSNKIINDLLSFSRVGKPATSPARIDKVIDDAITHTPIPENIRLTKKIAASLPTVEIDTDQIRQVLVNMITNAVQAMPEGGELTIETRVKDRLQEIIITDSGIGIAGENIRRIFDPLFTLKAKGIGLGLAVCKSIIDRHGGQIQVESSVGKGTVFTISLPLEAG